MNEQYYLCFNVRIKNAKLKNILREKQISLSAKTAEEAKRESVELVEKINLASSSGDRSGLEKFSGEIEDGDTVVFFGIAVQSSRPLSPFPGQQISVAPSLAHFN